MPASSLAGIANGVSGMQKDLAALSDPIVDLARQAGKAILEVYGTDFSVEAKEDRSPLTEADMCSHNIILKGLASLTPDLPVLSEESWEIPFSTRSEWREYWLVDPLDGTKEFVKRNGEFTVNIALIRDHRAVLGAVHVPVKNKSYYGCAEHGAFVRDGDADPLPIRTATKGPGPIKVVGSRSHPSASLREYLENLGSHEIVPMGSSLKLCLVAEGRADIYPRLGPTSEWDTAAAQAVVEAAGGSVTDTRGKPLLYNTKDDILNPHFLVFGDSSHDWTRYVPSDGSSK